DWGTRLSKSARPLSTIVPAAPAVVAVGEKAATNAVVDTIPVPSEMPATELGARAAAVEAVGGGTHEPPLEPGAGELGARWSARRARPLPARVAARACRRRLPRRQRRGDRAPLARFRSAPARHSPLCSSVPARPTL